MTDALGRGVGELRTVIWPPTRADGAAMQKQFDAAGLSCLVVSDVDALCLAVQHGAGAVIVSEEALLGHIAQLTKSFVGQPLWSDLPVIVLSRAGSETVAFSSLAPALGNLTVVERPMRASTLISQVRASLRARARQYEVRDLLASERTARGDAERASSTKDEFLATLSHELRTPLNAVLGWTQVLRQQPGASPDLVHGLSVIERNARAQAQIIEDLLDMSSIMSGKVRLELKPCDVAVVLAGTLETVKPAMDAGGVALVVSIGRLPHVILGDANRLQQILWNLLTNAAKFTPRGGQVEVIANEQQGCVVIEVRDTGEGIDPVFLPHVFDRFRQADGSSTRRHGGLGLGLSIVKQLVELHGGTIAAESAGHGEGATFRVVLPVAEGDAAHRAAVTSTDDLGATTMVLPPLPSLNLEGFRFLVVDDEADARALLERLLVERGSQVTTAASAELALQAIGESQPHVLISDIGMPGEDGYSPIRRIRALGGPVSRTAAIALTAYAGSRDRERALAYGFDRHLSKPVEPLQLFGAIESLLQQRPQ